MRPVAALNVVAVAIYAEHADVVVQLLDEAGAQLWTGTAKVFDSVAMGFVRNHRPAVGYNDVLVPLEIAAPGGLSAVRRCLGEPDHMTALTLALQRLAIIPKEENHDT